MSLNPQLARPLVQDFKFAELFREQLNWDTSTRLPQTDDISPASGQPLVQLRRRAIAELGGVVVYEVDTLSGPHAGQVPPLAVREKLGRLVQNAALEHVLIFVDELRTRSLWQWIKRPSAGGKTLVRSHLFLKGQPGDLFISKLAGLLLDVADFDADGNVSVKAVADRLRDALDVEQVTKKFYQDYQHEHLLFVDEIKGIADPQQQRWYASVLLHRMMFVYFLQRKQFLDGGRVHYLSEKYKQVREELGTNRYYSDFLRPLFFEGFAKPEAQRSKGARKLLGKIPYLNGGLFLPHDIEEENTSIKVPDSAFDRILKLFNQYSWNLNDLPGEDDDEISPDVLGYIFEKYINQKEFGAYYTRPEITEYLCEQTIQRLVLERMQEPELDAGTFQGKRQVLAARHYESIGDLLLDLDADQARKLVKDVLPKLSLLDPACGSGAFLVAALKTLVNLYSALIGQIRIKFQHDTGLQEWLAGVSEHRSEAYYIRRRIITDNLYGVDLMPEAVEIAKLRLFLALVATARTVDELEPLPNIDFNLLAGNSLVGLLRVNEDDFGRFNLFNEKTYKELVNEKSRLVREYKSLEGFDVHQAEKRQEIQEQRLEAIQTMNVLLGDKFNLRPNKNGVVKRIQFKEHSWQPRSSEIVYRMREIRPADMLALKPFHWSYEFEEIFNRGGFDAIITNPPWQVFEADEKEFFARFDENIQKKKLRQEEWREQYGRMLEDKAIRNEWIKHLDSFAHVADYFKNSPQFENQISYLNGRNVGSKINLNTYFVELCYRLLRPGGYCGMVIPSGIYTDLGAKQLRELLFSSTHITGLFGFENKNEIFENVHRSFKFVVLTFAKTGRPTPAFPAAFMRHDPSELTIFPKRGAFEISTAFVRKQSPDALTIPEITNPQDFALSRKIFTFPSLGESIADRWQARFSTEFNMTTDNKLFEVRPSATRLPLYEGKLIHQFTHQWGEPKYWIPERAGRNGVLGRTIDSGQPLGYQSYRIGFRDVSASTNERTLIATVLPPLVFCPHTMPVEDIIYESKSRNGKVHHEKVGLSAGEQLYLVSILNSFIIDYVARKQVTNHVSLFIMYSLPVPRLVVDDAAFAPIMQRAAKLICTTEEYAGLWKAAMGNEWSEKKVATSDTTRLQLRAELDALVAHLYGLTEEEFAYVLSTFPIVTDEVKAAALAAYLDVATGHIS